MQDSEEVTRSKLGESDAQYFVDWYGTSHGLMWEDGPHAGIRVMFVWRPDTTRDVGWIEMHQPFDGRTADGIGIGSLRSGVECAYGPSEQSETDDKWYTEQQVLHWVQFESDKVTSIWMMDRAFADLEE